MYSCLYVNKTRHCVVDNDTASPLTMDELSHNVVIQRTRMIGPLPVTFWDYAAGSLHAMLRQVPDIVALAKLKYVHR